MELARFEPRVKNKRRLRCCVPGCTSSTSKDLGLVFHNFPLTSKDFVHINNQFGERQMVKQHEAWKTILRIKTVTPSMRVCSLHFRINDYFLPGIPSEKRRLKKEVVPSLNLPIFRDIANSEIVQDSPLNQIAIQEIVFHHNYSSQTDTDYEIKLNTEQNHEPQKNQAEDTPNDNQIIEQVLIKIEDTVKDLLEENSNEYIVEYREENEEKPIKVEPKTEDFLEENDRINFYMKTEITEELIIKDESCFNDSEVDHISNNESSNISELNEILEKNKFKEIEANIIYNCKFCEKTFTNKADLEVHIFLHAYPVQNSKTARINILNKELKYRKYHKIFHTNKNREKQNEFHTDRQQYICETCFKIFTCPGEFEKHKLLHIDKKYECDVCHKGFTKRYHVKLHQRVHNQEKPYTCEVCLKKFSQKGNLEKHRYVHSEEKSYMCSICRKTFARIEYLNRHSRVHTGEKPYMCDICHKIFKRRTNLNAHKRIHKVKPYSCHDCNKYFASMKCLKEHQKVFKHRCATQVEKDSQLFLK